MGFRGFGAFGVLGFFGLWGFGCGKRVPRRFQVAHSARPGAAHAPTPSTHAILF